MVARTDLKSAQDFAGLGEGVIKLQEEDAVCV